jgi:threonine/homoserine/homoserine lactone efflux protein
MLDPMLFALAVLVILGTPGPTNTLLATGGAALGWRRAWRLIPAEMAGYTIAILVLGLLLGPAIAAQPWLARAMRLAVACFLLALAWKLWRRGLAGGARAGEAVTPGQVFLTTLLNPKAIILALGVVPFGQAPVWPWMLGFLAILAPVASAWVLFGALLGRVGGGAGGAWVPRLGAVVIAGFALLLGRAVFP